MSSFIHSQCHRSDILRALSFMEEQRKHSVNSKLIQNPAVTIPATVSFS